MGNNEAELGEGTQLQKAGGKDSSQVSAEKQRKRIWLARDLSPKDSAATKFGEKGSTSRGQPSQVEWHPQTRKNSRIVSQALIRGKIPLFFLMPRNQWSGCGRRDGGRHKSAFKGRIRVNERWESRDRLNCITRLEGKAKYVNTIFFLFPRGEFMEPAENHNMEF